MHSNPIAVDPDEIQGWDIEITENPSGLEMSCFIALWTTYGKAKPPAARTPARAGRGRRLAERPRLLSTALPEMRHERVAGARGSRRVPKDRWQTPLGTSSYRCKPCCYGNPSSWVAAQRCPFTDSHTISGGKKSRYITMVPSRRPHG